MPGYIDMLNSKPAQSERDLLNISKERQANDLQQMSTNVVENEIIKSVAKEYKLSPRETKLLYAIRKVENGRQGREFGVLNPEAMRFEKGDPVQSFTTQAKWAAGTIKKRFDGDLKKFSQRWAPIGADNDPTNLNANWLKNIKSVMGE